MNYSVIGLRDEEWNYNVGRFQGDGGEALSFIPDELYLGHLSGLTDGEASRFLKKAAPILKRVNSEAIHIDERDRLVRQLFEN